MEVTCYGSLEALPESYRALFEAAEKASFFNGRLWYRALLETAAAPDDRPCFYGVEEPGGGRALALLPAIQSSREQLPLGARLLSGCHTVYTMEFAPLLAADLPDRGAVIDALIGALAAERPRWDAVSLRLLDRESEVFGQILDAFARHGMAREPYFQFGNWHEEIAGLSFADYLASRGKTIRKTVARAVRNFDDRDNGRYEIFTGQGEGEPDLDAAVAAFKEVYGSSWKEAESRPEFIDRLIRDCAARGILRLANLYLDDRPVATWLVISDQGSGVLLKTAYDESLPSNLSVGGVLTFKVMQHLIDHDRVERIDFGIGDEPYKSKWLSKRRERWGIMAYNRRSPKGALLGALMKGRVLARRLRPGRDTK